MDVWSQFKCLKTHFNTFLSALKDKQWEPTENIFKLHLNIELFGQLNSICNDTRSRKEPENPKYKRSLEKCI